MPCRIIDLGNGLTAIARVRGKRQPVCFYCGRPGEKLCDFPIGGGKTCDMSLCRLCAIHTEPDTDLCPKHAKEKLAL
jgi:hypothetical protein